MAKIWIFFEVGSIIPIYGYYYNYIKLKIIPGEGRSGIYGYVLLSFGNCNVESVETVSIPNTETISCL